MTTRQLILKARNLWNVDYVPAHINKANRHKWIRSVLMLGDKWLLSTPVERKS